MRARYFTIVDYGQYAESRQTAQDAVLQLIDGSWIVYIPACDVENESGHAYWLTLQLVLTDTEVRLNVLEYDLVQ